MLNYAAKMSSMLPNGGLDLYEGAREAFDSVHQLRQSDTFDNLGSPATMGSSSVVNRTNEELCEWSHLYRMQAIDLAESAGVTNRLVNDSTILI